jgi:cytochrome P450
VTIGRKALEQFTFADGSVVPKNNWICIPTQAVMLDEANYKSPLEFDGFRFVGNDGKVPDDQKFDVARNDFPYWGALKGSW